METFFFYAFSSLAVIGAIILVAFRNPISSAIAMVASFVGVAILFIGLNAYFIGIVQVLVYTGAIMVLFVFIIMLLDLKAETRKVHHPGLVFAGVVIPLLFLVQICGVLPKIPGGDPAPLALEEAAKSFDREKNAEIHRSLSEGSLPDVNLVGLTIFGNKGDNETISTPGYNFPLQIVGVLLLVATVGVVALSLKKKSAAPPH